MVGDAVTDEHDLLPGQPGPLAGLAAGGADGVVAEADAPTSGERVDLVRADVERDSLPLEHGLDQLPQSRREDQRPVRERQLAEPVANPNVLSGPRDDLRERGADRPDLERDHVVQGQVAAEPRLRLVVDRDVAEALDHLHERVALRDRASRVRPRRRSRSRGSARPGDLDGRP